MGSQDTSIALTTLITLFMKYKELSLGLSANCVVFGTAKIRGQIFSYSAFKKYIGMNVQGIKNNRKIVKDKTYKT
jgi:hypothetical protein